VAKDKSKKSKKRSAAAAGEGPRPEADAPASSKKAASPRVKAVVRSAGKKAADLASNPAVAEVVAAALVAAAAALKNPAKARAMAESVSDELESASANAAGKGSAFWQLALDIARRSVDAMGADQPKAKAKGGKKKSKK
jgi:hypothetical protein